MKLKVLRIRHEGIDTAMPEKATGGSAGFDLRAAIKDDITIYPGESVLVPTGIAVGFPGTGYAGLVFARSGLSLKHGVALANGVGLIDSDYTGEIKVPLHNYSKEPYRVKKGERVAQLMVAGIPDVEIEETEDLGNSDRLDKGFGSTGKF